MYLQKKGNVKKYHGCYFHLNYLLVDNRISKKNNPKATIAALIASVIKYAKNNSPAHNCKHYYFLLRSTGLY
jgi:hypothetical protein